MLRGIITGLGGRGLYWVSQVRQSRDCELVAYVEPAEANRRRATDQMGIPASSIFESLEAAIQKVKADFVLDVTPPSVHHQIAETAFKAGLHVLGEKPLSDDLLTARRIADAGAKARRKHMITQNYRFSSLARTTRRVLGENLIGQPGQADIRFYMNWADIPNSHYVTQPYMLINDMMVHHFDLMRYVLGADPLAVQAITWNHPWGWHKGDAAHAIVFEFPNNLWVTHVSVGCAVGQRTTYNGDWRIEGPKGSISWDSDSRMWHAHLHRTNKPVRSEIFPDAVPGSEQAILSEFAGAIREDREPECSAADNLRTVAMVFAAIESAKQRRRIAMTDLS